MNKYEVVYIIDPAVEEEARKELIAKFNDLITGNGGSVEKVEEWGKRRLAYAIDIRPKATTCWSTSRLNPNFPRNWSATFRFPKASFAIR